MPTITISSETTTVNSPISGDTSYIVEGSGTLDVVNDGTVSGLITISSGGISGATGQCQLWRRHPRHDDRLRWLSVRF